MSFRELMTEVTSSVVEVVSSEFGTIKSKVWSEIRQNYWSSSVGAGLKVLYVWSESAKISNFTGSLVRSVPLDMREGDYNVLLR